MKNSIVAVAAVAAAMFIPSQATAGPPPFMCNGISSGATYQDVIVPAGDTCTLSDTRVTGNVTVQKGGSFFVNTGDGLDATIAGNIAGNQCGEIDLESTGATGRIVVGGNLTITNCTSIAFQGGRGSSFSPPTPPPTLVIGGNVKCDNNVGGCVFDYAFIGGNFECSGNFNCELQTDTVGGDATLTGNTNVTAIANGSVGGRVNCTENSNCSLDSDAIGNNVTLANNGAGSDVSNNAIGGNINCVGNTVFAVTPNTIAGTKSGQCSAF